MSAEAVRADHDYGEWVAPSDGGEAAPTGSEASTAAPVDGPRRNADPDSLAAKQARWFEPHIAPINRLVAEIATNTGREVPYVDPDSGGVNTRVLLLLEGPSGGAAHRSKMISIDNDGGTTANLWRAHQAVGLAREHTMMWNAVPWYLGGSGRIDGPKEAELTEGRSWLVRLLELLPLLEVTIALGRVPEKSLRPLRSELQARGVIIFAAPHPSQRVYNVPGRGARGQVHRTFEQAAEVIAAGPSARRGHRRPS
jgi:uracil-DNA glycosylase